MDRDGVQRVLQAIGHTHPLTQDGEWLKTSCPLAPWLHAGGTDNNPSFGVHLSDHDRSVFHCFSCHRRGTMSMLLSMVERYTGDSFRDLKDEIDHSEMFMFELPEWDMATSTVPLKRLEALPESALLAYPEVPLDYPYLAERDITNPEAIRAMELRVDPSDSRGAERLLFPVRGIDGALHGFTGRAVNTSVTPKVRDYANLPKESLLLGSHRVDRGKSICVVEGLFSYATMVDFGFQAVALMHSSLTEQQARLFLELGSPLYLFLDNDKAGRDGVAFITKKLKGYLPLFSVTYPASEEVNGKPVICDPNDLYRDEIQAMIDGADIL